MCPLLWGTWPTTQACALTGNRTSDPLLHRLVLNSLSHTSQGSSPTLRELKSGSWEDICTTMFTAALFTVAKVWEQPECLSMNEWMEKMWFIHKMEYYSVFKRREPSICYNMDEAGGHYSKWDKPVGPWRTNTAWFHWCEASKIVKLIKNRE